MQQYLRPLGDGSKLGKCDCPIRILYSIASKQKFIYQ